mgnify:CR=1 FL=1
METSYADDLAKLTTSATDDFHGILDDQLTTFQSRIKKAGLPPTRVLIASYRSIDQRDFKGISEEFIRWVKVHILNGATDRINDWYNLIKDWITQGTVLAGQTTLLELNTDIEFNEKDIKLLRWIEERSLRDADLIQGASDESVIKTLWDVVMEGKYTVDKAAEALRDSFLFSKGRAQTIARTEMISAGRSGQFQGDYQSGMVIGKTWHSAHDSKTRHEHAKADGQTVRFDEPFTVWGEQMMFPGDSSGSAKNIINCRCFYTRILEGEEDKLKSALED